MPSRSSPEPPLQQDKRRSGHQRLGITSDSAQNQLCRIRHRWFASTITNAPAGGTPRLSLPAALHPSVCTSTCLSTCSSLRTSWWNGVVMGIRPPCEGWDVASAARRPARKRRRGRGRWRAPRVAAARARAQGARFDRPPRPCVRTHGQTGQRPNCGWTPGQRAPGARRDRWQRARAEQARSQTSTRRPGPSARCGSAPNQRDRRRSVLEAARGSRRARRRRCAVACGRGR